MSVRNLRRSFVQRKRLPEKRSKKEGKEFFLLTPHSVLLDEKQVKKENEKIFYFNSGSSKRITKSKITLMCSEMTKVFS